MSEILDELDASFAKQEETAKEIAKTWEEIKVADAAWKETTELIDKLNRQITEDEAEKKKLSFTVDFLKTQNETLTKENLWFKYGRTDEEWILGLINNDTGIKNIISQTIKSQNWNPADKEKLVDAYKQQLETLTWLDFSEFINSSKQKIEEENIASEPDVTTNVNTWKEWESMFL
jgi:septal ring factor EnvC (AmiA/AmiB activator)